MRSYTLILPIVLLDLISANYWLALPAESMRAINLPRDSAAAPVYAVSLRAEPSTLRAAAHHANETAGNHARLAQAVHRISPRACEPYSRALLIENARHFSELATILQRATLPAVRAQRPVFHLYRNGVQLTRCAMRVRPCAANRGKLTDPERVCAIEAPRPDVRDALQVRRARHKLRTLARKAKRFA